MRWGKAAVTPRTVPHTIETDCPNPMVCRGTPSGGRASGRVGLIVSDAGEERDGAAEWDAADLPDLLDSRDAAAYEVETYGELRPHLRREWLSTNGLGGFAHGTVPCVNTRRYHALLVAATLPPVGRVVAVSRTAESLYLSDGGPPVRVGAAFFRGELDGEGPALLRRFRLTDDTATWEYDAGGTKLFRELFVCWHRNAAAVRYTLVPGPLHRGRPVRLEVQPFAPLRDFHALRHTREGDHLQSRPRDDGMGTTVCQRDLELHLWARCDGDGCAYAERPDWWYAHTYPMEAARGMDDREDLFSPGTFSLEATGGPASFELWASLGDGSPLDWEQERGRRREGMRLREMPTIAQQRLVRAAADFVVKRRRPDGMPGTTIIAGYPWLGDWGRDTFVALPGLLLTAGRHGVAGQVLSTFAHFVDGGMIPSRFDEQSNEPTYDAVDAGLWFVHAAGEYLRVTRDADTYESILRPACEAVLDGYAAGTRHGIGVDPADGLVAAGVAGDGGPAVTWMDARDVDDEVDPDAPGEPLTPRRGKAVEINALWHHALRLLGRDAEADRVRQSFNDAFWVGGGRGLADVVTGGPGAYGRDASLRPNQIFAVSLRHGPLDAGRQREVVDAVRRELLTPLGLRSLARGEPGYEPRYTGPPRDRGRARHNGTVWPWLIGPFLEAHLRITGRSPRGLSRARAWLAPLLEHLERDGCVGGVCELADAEYPHRPGGCFAQAWATAEVLRLAVELEM